MSNKKSSSRLSKKSSRHSSKKLVKKKIIPKFSIINRPSAATVEFNLEKDQTILCSAGHMSYMDSHIITSAHAHGGIFEGIKRMLLTDTSMYMTKYTGTKEKNMIACASFLPGDIMPLQINPGEKYMLSHHSLISFTPNLELNTKSRLKGFFVQEGLFQVEISNQSKESGMVWLSAYGGFYSREIKKDESFKLDSGLFLAANSDINYEITKLGSIKTAILSGEGFMMHFYGPCKIYCIGRNINALDSYIASIARSVSTK